MQQYPLVLFRSKTAYYKAFSVFISFKTIKVSLPPNSRTFFFKILICLCCNTCDSNFTTCKRNVFFCQILIPMLLYRVLADWCKAQLGILFLKKKISMAIVHCGIVDECLINLALTTIILDVKREAY